MCVVRIVAVCNMCREADGPQIKFGPQAEWQGRSLPSISFSSFLNPSLRCCCNSLLSFCLAPHISNSPHKHHHLTPQSTMSVASKMVYVDRCCAGCWDGRHKVG